MSSYASFRHAQMPEDQEGCPDEIWLEGCNGGRRTVTIPGCVNHAGHHAVMVTLDWICRECGGPRGDPHPALSYDGSRRLNVDGWTNACGHVDSYAAMRVEAGVAECHPNTWPHG